MRIQKTTITATHTNEIQVTATFAFFNTSTVPYSYSIQIALSREHDSPNEPSFFVSSESPVKQVNVRGRNVFLSGQLTLDLNLRVILFEGNIVFPGQVNVDLKSMIVAVV